MCSTQMKAGTCHKGIYACGNSQWTQDFDPDTADCCLFFFKGFNDKFYSQDEKYSENEPICEGRYVITYQIRTGVADYRHEPLKKSHCQGE